MPAAVFPLLTPDGHPVDVGHATLSWSHVRKRSRWTGIVAMIALVCGLAGCGTSKRPPLGTVEGVVTLDGVPLPSALVVFTPDGPGRSATAITDTAGRYALTFLRDIAGANLGPHTVRITTAGEGRGRKETLPARYHSKTTLVAMVEPGANTFDFALTSR